MFAQALAELKRWGSRLRLDAAGSVAQLFALSLLPVATFAGAALDYSRATSAKTALQVALDGAVLAGAQNGTSQWADVAKRSFAANLPAGVSGATPSFSRNENKVYSGSVSATIATSLMSLAGTKEIAVAATSSAAAAAAPDDSCILTLDPGEPLSHESLTFNGAPKVVMKGCTIRSNTSLRCNGHGTGAKASIAAGSASGCSNSMSNAPVVPDIYAALASKIERKCSNSPGATWSPGSPPPASKMVTVQKSTHVEYHVCGDLTLSGNGFLTGNGPTTDSVIVIENGSLTIAKNASVSLSRVAIVFTRKGSDDDSDGASINFPNGNGQGATLSLSPPTAQDNPWRGISIYYDPKLKADVDHDWGPGATLNADGVIYMPNSHLRVHGNPSSNNPLCTKFVLRSFVSNGAVNLNQSVQGCSALGVKQWDGGGKMRLVG